MAAKKTTAGTDFEAIANNNRAMRNALLSLRKRGIPVADELLDRLITLSVMKSKHYAFLTGKISREELEAAINAAWNYRRDDDDSIV